MRYRAYHLKHSFLGYRLVMILLIYFNLGHSIAYGQQHDDTLFINTYGEYPIYKSLLIYETMDKLDVKYVFDSPKKNIFTPLFPKTSFNNLTSVTPYYWLLLKIKNRLPNDENFYYSLNSPGLNIVKAYKREGLDKFIFLGKAGFYIPIAERQLRGHDVEFCFQLHSGEAATILLEIENPSGQNAFFLPQLSDTNTFREKRENYYWIMGLIAGLMLSAFILNIFFAISLKAKIHYLYALYILCVLYEIFNLEGITENRFGNNNYKLAELIIHVFPSICMILMTKIMQWFLVQKRTNSYFKMIIDITTLITMLIIVLFILDYLLLFKSFVSNIIQLFQAIFFGLQILLIFISAIEKTVQKYRLAWVYLLATFWLFVGLFEFVLVFIGVNDIELVKNRHPNDMQAGLVIESLVVFVAIIYRYNVFKKDREKLLIEVSQQQQNLFEKVVAAEEEERMRIATDLHDDVGSTLSILNLQISNIATDATFSRSFKKQYDSISILSIKAAKDINYIAQNLLPRDFVTEGVFVALSKRKDELNCISSIHYFLVTDGDESKMDHSFSIIIYRIVNELMNNILKHSHASEATIQIFIENRSIQIMVEDNGIGFDLSNSKYGIGFKSITGRVALLKGLMQLDSSKKGTTIIIDIPI